RLPARVSSAAAVRPASPAPTTTASAGALVMPRRLARSPRQPRESPGRDAGSGADPPTGLEETPRDRARPVLPGGLAHHVHRIAHDVARVEAEAPLDQHAHRNGDTGDRDCGVAEDGDAAELVDAVPVYDVVADVEDLRARWNRDGAAFAVRALPADLARELRSVQTIGPVVLAGVRPRLSDERHGTDDGENKKCGTSP